MDERSAMNMKRIRPTGRNQLESLESRRLLTAYTVDLGTLGGATTATSDINASGQVVGTATRPDGNTRAFLWQNGVMMDLGTLGGNYSTATGVNDAGQVVGQSAASTAQYRRAFLLTPEDTDGNGKPDRWYRDTNGDGKNDLMRDLGTIGGNYVEAAAEDVNNLGQVVGSVSTDWLHGSVTHAFRWQNGVMTDMGTFGGSRSGANAINDAGQITGWYSAGRFLWKGGVVTLGVGGTDVNASGQLVDSVQGFSQIWTPTVPNGSSGTFRTLERMPPLDPSWGGYGFDIGTAAQSVNAAGHVVGSQGETYLGENGNGHVSRGVRWVNGVPEELPLWAASAINDAGQISGTDGERALLLTGDQFVLPLMTIADTSVTEGNTGTRNATFTVTLSRASAQPITVHYATADGGAVAGTDYLAASGTLTFAPGQTTRTIPVTVLGDRVPEDEGFMLTLRNATNAIIASGGPANGTRNGSAGAEILDDEPRVTGRQVTVVEGNTGSTNAVITWDLSVAYDQPVTMTYSTRDGSAVAGEDFLAASGTLTFAPGQTTAQFSVTVLGDRVPEAFFSGGSETLGFDAFSPSGNAQVLGLRTLDILDDEPSVALHSEMVTVIEGSAGGGGRAAVFTARLSRPYDREVTVDYFTSDLPPEEYDPLVIATAGVDYQARSGTLSFAPGETSRTISVPIIGDALEEASEYFRLSIDNPSANAVIDWTASAFGEIVDDDGPGKVWIGPASGGDWHENSNWSPFGAPQPFDRVTLSSGQSVNLPGSAQIAGLTLTGGASLTIPAAAAGNRVLRTAVLTIDGTSKLNLNDNDLIIDYPNSSGGTPMADVLSKIIAGRAATPGGICSSTANGSAGLQALGVAEARDVLGLTGSQTATFAGQTVDATCVLVKFTYAGDANLDGFISGDDYSAIDFANATPGASGWANGDFNYDGIISGDDYAMIDFNIAAQGAPL
jgi:probable HAF family extracellular repeat protein